MTPFNDVVDAVVKIGGMATPVLLVAVPMWLNRQTKQLKAHSDENMAKINAATADVTGTHKAVKDA